MSSGNANESAGGGGGEGGAALTNDQLEGTLMITYTLKPHAPVSHCTPRLGHNLLRTGRGHIPMYSTAGHHFAVVLRLAPGAGKIRHL